MHHFIIRVSFLFLLFFFGSSSIVLSQEKEKFTISGYVKDVSNGEYSVGASVYIKELLKGGNTNEYGFYSITVESGTYHLIVSYIGYKTIEKEIVLDKDIRLSLEIGLNAVTAKTVEVSSEQGAGNVSSTTVGAVKLNIEEIKKIPAFMGEVDILKTIQLLPSVKSAGEGNAGLYVRGGGPDQNLILLDEAVVYNPAHLMGLFSVFNGDAVKNMTMISGGMPAKYGGRMASVLDISMKEGNSKKFQVDGGIGLISSRLTVQGPIKRDTTSFIISARRSYADIIIKPFLSNAGKKGNPKLHFYDFNAKVNHRISDKDRLFLSGYFGRDVFGFSDVNSGFNVGMSWGNSTGVVRWNHLFSDKLFMNVSGIFSNYSSSVESEMAGFEFKMFSGIQDWNAKIDFAFFPNVRHEIRYGANYIFHTFTPTSITAKSGDTELDFGDVKRDKVHEAAAYISDDFILTDKIKIHAGLRYSYFQQIGPFDRYIKDPTTGQTTETIHYNSNEKVQEYGGLEPRINARFELGAKSSIKASYTHNLQYIHLASLSAISFPTDVWVPSSQRVKPQIGDQFSLGYFRNFKENTYEASVEFYYKEMQNQVEYKDGSVAFTEVNDNADNSFTFGKGNAYGVELFIKKRAGKFNGWIGYTLSYTKRQFDEINLGKEFYAKYDRRHDASLVLIYDINKEWSVSTIGVYGTGNAISIPESYYFIDVNFVPEYGERNTHRLPAYHRVDLSATFTPDRAKKLAAKRQRKEEQYKAQGKDPSTVVLPKKWAKNYSSSWTFSIYNVYNRHNPFLIYFSAEGNVLTGDYQAKAKQVYLLGFMPGVSWNFKF